MSGECTNCSEHILDCQCAKKVPDCKACGSAHHCYTCLHEQQWIRVKDRLPEDRQKILAYGSALYDSPLCESCWPQLEFKICSYKEKYGFEFGECSCELDVTHWMPLPSAPSARNDNAVL